MEKITLYKNQSDIFNCHFNIDGASPKNTKIRLCLEFSDNFNLFFHGDLKENGDCSIEIPKLKNIEQTKCKMFVEAVADSIYFKVYEAEAELKNSVEITMQKPSFSKPQPQAKVELEHILHQEQKPEPIVEKPKPRLKSFDEVIKAKKEEPKKEEEKNPYLPGKTK